MKKLFALALVGSLLVMSGLFAGQITDKAARASDVYQLRKELVYAASHKLLGSAAISSATVYLTIVSTPTAIVNGAFVTLTATSTVSFSSTTSVAASKYCLFAIGIEADGSYVTKQSDIVAYDKDLVLPLFDQGTTLIGQLKIVCDADGVFTPGTTSVTDASITATITNLAGLPLSLTVNQR